MLPNGCNSDVIVISSMMLEIRVCGAVKAMIPCKRAGIENQTLLFINIPGISDPNDAQTSYLFHTFSRGLEVFV